MLYEVDIIAVGDESQSGDAFAFRFGNFLNNPEDQKVVVIDGGFKESGEKLVKRIRDEYNTNHVDLVISTHPDNDHISGLHIVLEELSVSKLWMHRPWLKSEQIKKITENRNPLPFGLSVSKFKKSLESAYDLERLAISKDIKIEDPYQGKTEFDGVLHVLGPDEDFYMELVTNFEKGGSYSLLEKTKRIISEVWYRDELIEPEEGSVSARNNSSVIVLARFGDSHCLFCGDAGVDALHRATDYADSINYNIANEVNYQQVPHHGSKRNLSPSILERIIGPIQPENIRNNKRAFISAAAKGSPKHPSKKVMNALTRRGVGVVPPTCGQDQCLRSLDVPTRENWVSLSILDFFSSYEEDED